VDSAGFPKDRYFYYSSIFQPTQPFIHVFPHWTFAPGAAVPPIWVYTAAPEAELFVNGASLGRKAVPRFSHAAWENVTFSPGALQAVAYATVGGSTPWAQVTRTTAGAAAALRLSFKDGVGAGGLVAGCGDVALVAVEVLDADGSLVPDAAHNVSFLLTPTSGSASALRLDGTANGDPACHVNNKSPARPVFHGLAVAVLLGGAQEGTATLLASTPGLASASLDVAVQAAPQGWRAAWCPSGPVL